MWVAYTCGVRAWCVCACVCGVCVRVYLCVVCVCVCMFVWCVYVYLCVYVRACVYIYMRTYVRVCACARVCYVYVCVCGGERGRWDRCQNPDSNLQPLDPGSGALYIAARPDQPFIRTAYFCSATGLVADHASCQRILTRQPQGLGTILSRFHQCLGDRSKQFVKSCAVLSRLHQSPEEREFFSVWAQFFVGVLYRTRARARTH